MLEFFSDRTGIITEDVMYPQVLEDIDPYLLMNTMIAYGDYTSRNIQKKVVSMVVGDGLSLFSYCHTKPNTSMTFRNLLKEVPALSQETFKWACRMLWENNSIPDTLITGPNEDMIAKANEIQSVFFKTNKWVIKHSVCPLLTEEKKYSWLLADSRKSTCHYKKITPIHYEMCIFTWDWIVASFSTIKPVL